ncbi:MAG: hypothetical protein FE045_05655 [Thermoplasmata archaeon]|nr:MAG: hypothetical protein FE045_05655 [Thermoplasmata archaeon]MCD6474072.1 hypothetical protein [Thermoplasmata archaeon]
MKKPKRHLITAFILLFVAILIYIIKIIDWKIEVLLLILIFPYLSFSIIFSNIKVPKKKNAIDVIRKRYST